MYRRTIPAGLVFAVILIVSLITPLTTASADGVEAQTNVVVRLRTGPGQGYAQMEEVPVDVSLPVQARNADSQWLLVQFEDQRGWVAAWLTTITGDLNSLPVSGEVIGGPVIVVTLDTLQIRNSPGLSAPVIGSVPVQTELMPAAVNAANTWFLIDYQGLSGWIAGGYVSINGDLSLLPVSGSSEPQTPPPSPTEPPPPPADDPYPVTLTGVGPNVRSIFLKGQQLGNNPQSFSKVGDSETSEGQFLQPLDTGDYFLGNYTHFEELIQYFAGSYVHRSQAAFPGFPVHSVLDPVWTNPELCEPDETPLACEFRIQRPSFVFILVSTWPTVPLGMYRTDLEKVVEYSIDQGVVPILSTLPHRESPAWAESEPLNEIIREVAVEYQVPLWDLWLTTETLIDRGICIPCGGTHLSIPPDGKVAFFIEPNLQYGATRRNLEALQILYIMRYEVIGQ